MCDQQEPTTFKIEDKIKTQLEVLKRMDTYVISTNAKCAIIISFCAAVLGWLSLNVDKVLEGIHTPWIHCLSAVLMILIVASAILSLVLALRVMFPVTHSSMESRRGNSLIFFGDVANINGGSGIYTSRLLGLNSDEMLKDLSEQIFTLSGIAQKKFDRLETLTYILIYGGVIPIGLFISLRVTDQLLKGMSS